MNPPVASSWIVALLAAIAAAAVAGSPTAATELGSGSHPVGSPTVTDAPETDARIAVLPLTNRSGSGAPLKEIRRSLINQLEQDRGFSVVDDATLEAFMRRHRMRYTAGLNRELARVLELEVGASAALITSLDLYQDGKPPKLALTSRLVSTGDEPRILWMDSTVLAGDQSPGIADVGLIDDFDVVLGRVTSTIAERIPREATTVPAAEGQIPRPKRKTSLRFRPKVFFSAPNARIASSRAGRVVVLPFANDSTTKNAGEILSDLLMLHLVEAGALVVEPGVVRQALLEARQIYPEGPSIPEIDILRVTLRADVVLFGEVQRYLERSGGTVQPFVDFSLRAIDGDSQQLIWSSISYSRGNAGVAFFDVGAVSTAHGLASKMAQALVATVQLKEQKAEKKSRRRGR